MGTVQRFNQGEMPGHNKALLLEGENEVLRLIIEGTPLPVVLKELAKVAEHQGPPGLLATIFLAESDGQHLRFAAAPSSSADFREDLYRIPIGLKSGSCGSAASRRAPVLVTDIARADLGPEFAAFAAKYRLRACWSMPIISSRGGLLGVFAFYYRDSAVPADSDRAVLEMLSRTCALAIERSQAERNLSESEERLRSLSRCSPIGIFSTSVERNFTYVNPRFREISSFAYEKNVEYWLENAVDPEHRGRVLAHWNRAVAGRMEFTEEFPVVTVDGAGRWVNLRAAPMKSSTGAHIGYVGTVEDTSERRRTESDLRRESTFRQAIEESLPCGIVTFDLQGRRTYVNPAFAQMIGCPPEELVGETPVFSNWPAEHGGRMREDFLKILTGNPPREGLELLFQRRNGELFTVLLTFSELLDHDQKRYGWVASVLDITERKRAEELLRQSEAGLKLALDVGKMGAWEWDIARNAIHWSPQIEKIHGIVPGTFSGAFDDFHKDMNPEHRPRVFAAIEEAIRDRTAYHVEYEIIRSDGRHIWLEARGQVFTNELGDAVKMAGLCIDITERKAQQERLLVHTASS